MAAYAAASPLSGIDDAFSKTIHAIAIGLIVTKHTGKAIAILELHHSDALFEIAFFTSPENGAVTKIALAKPVTDPFFFGPEPGILPGGFIELDRLRFGFARLTGGIAYDLRSGFGAFDDRLGLVCDKFGALLRQARGFDRTHRAGGKGRKNGIGRDNRRWNACRCSLRRSRIVHERCASARLACSGW